MYNDMLPDHKIQKISAARGGHNATARGQNEDIIVNKERALDFGPC